MKKLSLFALGSLFALAALLLACGAPSDDAAPPMSPTDMVGVGLPPGMNVAAPATPSDKPFQFTFIIYGAPGNPFWIKVQNGAKEAGEILGCDVSVQFAENDSNRQNDMIEVAVAKKHDGIGMGINYDDAYDEVVQKAIDAGVPVIAFNVDDSQRGAGNARLAYVGQDMTEAGYTISKRLIQDGGLKAGDFVLCPVEHPEAIYAVQRYDGAKRAFDEVGIESKVIKTGATSLDDTLSKITQNLLGRKDTAGILAMGGMPLEVSPQAAAEAGLDIPIAGFDLSSVIAQNIVDGKTIATVDQQPFYQGFLVVTQLYYNRKYGMLPCDINTGGGLVDKSNIEMVLELSDSIR